MIIKI